MVGPGSRQARHVERFLHCQRASDALMRGKETRSSVSPEWNRKAGKGDRAWEPKWALYFQVWIDTISCMIVLGFWIVYFVTTTFLALSDSVGDGSGTEWTTRGIIRSAETTRRWELTELLATTQSTARSAKTHLLYQGSTHFCRGPSMVYHLFVWIKFHWNTVMCTDILPMVAFTGQDRVEQLGLWQLEALHIYSLGKVWRWLFYTLFQTITHDGATSELSDYSQLEREILKKKKKKTPKTNKQTNMGLGCPLGITYLFCLLFQKE